MDGPALRMLDANANRAREALRVMEDYARFALDSDGLSAALKDLRHAVTAATGPFLPEALLHRDTPNDVGTDNKTAAETSRAGLPAVVAAAGKRLTEALRVIEELLKIADAAAARAVERARYDAYDLEQRLALTFSRGHAFRHVRLYVLITESICKRPWLETAELAIAGGADCLQLREKHLDGGEFLRRAKQLVALCRQRNVLCIINDRPDVAVVANAHGVHLGQEDLPAADARKIVGPNRLVGVSTHNIEQARQALLDGADYIGVGPVFPSPTKPRDILPGLPYARDVAARIPLPSVAIAGITESNVAQVTAAGIRAVAVTAAVIAADDPRAAAARLKSQLPDL